MTTIYFPAIVERAADGYGVFFPDLPGLASAGDSLQEAARNAEEGLRGHFQLMLEGGEKIPAASELDTLTVDPDTEEAARLLVRVDLPASQKAVRINITLPEDLVRRIDARAGNRSRFLASAAERALADVER
jgi:predicted RNase H-like HicB family nuclease